MAQFSMEIICLTGSVLRGNQHPKPPRRPAPVELQDVKLRHKWSAANAYLYAHHGFIASMIEERVDVMDSEIVACLTKDRSIPIARSVLKHRLRSHDFTQYNNT